MNFATSDTELWVRSGCVCLIRLTSVRSGVFAHGDRRTDGRVFVCCANSVFPASLILTGVCEESLQTGHTPRFHSGPARWCWREPHMSSHYYSLIPSFFLHVSSFIYAFFFTFICSFFLSLPVFMMILCDINMNSNTGHDEAAPHCVRQWCQIQLVLVLL